MRVKIEGFRFLREKYPESGAQFGVIVDTSRLREHLWREQEHLGVFALVLGQNCPVWPPPRAPKSPDFTGARPLEFLLGVEWGLGKSTRSRTHLNLRGGHETLGQEGNTPVTRTFSLLPMERGSSS